MSKDDLIDKYLEGSLSKRERKTLIKWVKEDQSHLNHFKSRIRSYSYVIPMRFDSEKAFNKFYLKIKKKEIRKKRRQSYLAIAASLTLLLGLGTVYHFTNFDFQDHTPEVTTPEPLDEMPQRIQITLADGTKQTLQKNANVVIMDSLGNTIAETKEKVLSFKSSNLAQLDTTLNRIDIPYGEKLRIKLSDGTLVWLNSGSTFKFAQNFSPSSKQRKVQLIGEAYFEVTENKHQPFIVSTEELDIKVLGTKFNVSSYRNDPNNETTLMEGAVQVYSSANQQQPIILAPNQQVVFQKSSNHFKKRSVDASVYNSWIKGSLIVNHLTFTEILNKVERRYNVEITNKAVGVENDLYKGKFNNESLPEILETIALSSSIQFSIKGKQVVIYNKKTSSN